MRTTAAWAKAHWPLGLVLALLGLAVVVINPLREAAFADDWSYALTVKHLLDTGAYRLDNWAAANPVAQVYWGALFARLFGYSFASLKVSTLVLLAGGLGGMYLLAREHGLSARQAGLVTLVLLVNPLTLLLGFSYMTDIPFLACLLLGLAFYTRGVRLHGYWLVVLGSVFAAAAILIRSFGVAFLPGLGLVWLFSTRKRETLPLFVAAAALPLIATAWQVVTNTTAPNWSLPYHLRWQLAFVTNFAMLLPEMVWRLGIILEYMAFFSLPLLPGLLAECSQSVTSRPRADEARQWRRQELTLLTCLLLFLAVANALGAGVLQHPLLMPVIDWNFDELSAWPVGVLVILTLIMAIGALLFARAIVLRYVGRGSWRGIPDHERLLDLVTLGLLFLQITYFQFADEYLLTMLPFVLIVAGISMGAVLERLAIHTFAGAVAFAIVGMLWVRGINSTSQALWAASDNLVAQGVSARQVYSSWEWASYQGAFDEYIPSYRGKPRDYRIGYFNDGLAKIYLAAQYHVLLIEQHGPHNQLVATGAYRDMFLREQHVYVYRHLP